VGVRMSRISIPCLECGGSGRTYFQTAADAWRCIEPCSVCNGEGSARCEARGCNEIAADAVVIGRDAIPMCERCMEQWRADVEATP
jgi:DnaJ-class molecular chaperone